MCSQEHKSGKITIENAYSSIINTFSNRAICYYIHAVSLAVLLKVVCQNFQVIYFLHLCLASHPGISWFNPAQIKGGNTEFSPYPIVPLIFSLPHLTLVISPYRVFMACQLGNGGLEDHHC